MLRVRKVIRREIAWLQHSLLPMFHIILIVYVLSAAREAVGLCPKLTRAIFYLEVEPGQELALARLSAGQLLGRHKPLLAASSLSTWALVTSSSSFDME